MLMENVKTCFSIISSSPYTFKPLSKGILYKVCWHNVGTCCNKTPTFEWGSILK